jgi:hypothetical protein
VIGSRGRVTGTIGPGLIGEILLSIRGGTEAFYAYSANPEERLEWDAGSRGRLRTTPYDAGSRGRPRTTPYGLCREMATAQGLTVS